MLVVTVMVFSLGHQFSVGQFALVLMLCQDKEGIILKDVADFEIVCFTTPHVMWHVEVHT